MLIKDPLRLKEKSGEAERENHKGYRNTDGRRISFKRTGQATKTVGGISDRGLREAWDPGSLVDRKKYTGVCQV